MYCLLEHSEQGLNGFHKCINNAFKAGQKVIEILEEDRVPLRNVNLNSYGNLVDPSKILGTLRRNNIDRYKRNIKNLMNLLCDLLFQVGCSISFHTIKCGSISHTIGIVGS